METWIVIGVIVLFALYIVGIYNKLVELKNRFKNAFAQIDVQLKRRYDLIPNLIETAKAYMKHESETLEAVVNARNTAQQSLKAVEANVGDLAAMGGLASAESQLAGALEKLNVVMEAYPDLKASENMMQLSEELSSTENKVAFSRQGYNDAVMAYNIYKQSFPQNLFAAPFGHAADAAQLEFEDSEQIQAAPKANF